MLYTDVLWSCDGDIADAARSEPDLSPRMMRICSSHEMCARRGSQPIPHAVVYYWRIACNGSCLDRMLNCTRLNCSVRVHSLAAVADCCACSWTDEMGSSCYLPAAVAIARYIAAQVSIEVHSVVLGLTALDFLFVLNHVDSTEFRLNSFTISAVKF